MQAGFHTPEPAAEVVERRDQAAVGAGRHASAFDDFAEGGVQIQARIDAPARRAQAGHAAAQPVDLAEPFVGVAQVITAAGLRSKRLQGVFEEESERETSSFARVDGDKK